MKPRIEMRVRIRQGLLDLVADGGKVARDAMYEALRKAGELWHRDFLPEHFKTTSPARYPGMYVARSVKYSDAKQRKFGHRNPMVWEGKLLAALSGNKAMSRRRKGGENRVVSVLRMRGTRALNLWTGARKHDFRRSITAVSKAESRTIRDLIESHVRKAIREHARRGSMVDVKASKTKARAAAGEE